MERRRRHPRREHLWRLRHMRPKQMAPMSEQARSGQSARTRHKKNVVMEEMREEVDNNNSTQQTDNYLPKPNGLERKWTRLLDILKRNTRPATGIFSVFYGDKIDLTSGAKPKGQDQRDRRRPSTKKKKRPQSICHQNKV